MTYQGVEAGFEQMYSDSTAQTPHHSALKKLHHWEPTAHFWLICWRPSHSSCSLSPPTFMVQLNQQLPLKISLRCAAVCLFMLFRQLSESDPIYLGLSQCFSRVQLLALEWPVLWWALLCPFSSHALSRGVESQGWGRARTWSPTSRMFWVPRTLECAVQMTLSHSQGLLGIVPWPVLPREALLPSVVPAKEVHTSRFEGYPGVGSGNDRTDMKTGVSIEMNLRPLKIQEERG